MKIFVGNLHCKASERELYDLFIVFGPVLLIELRMDGNGKSYGYAYVHMKEIDNGKSAIRKLNGMNFMNQFLDIYEVY